MEHIRAVFKHFASIKDQCKITRCLCISVLFPNTLSISPKGSLVSLVDQLPIPRGVTILVVSSCRAMAEAKAVNDNIAV